MKKLFQADAFTKRCKQVLFVSALYAAAGHCITGCNKKDEAPVDHEPPIAIAGEDMVIKLPLDSILLDGSASKKTVADINSYAWYNLTSLPANIKNEKSARTMVTGLVPGVYLFQLRIRDVDNLFARDTIQIVVKDREDPPKAVAGNDFRVELPVRDQFELDGGNSTDTNNNIKSYSWRKLSGPHAVLNYENEVKALVSHFQEGNYSFELRVTDSTELFSSDTVHVEVVEVAIDGVPDISFVCESKITDSEKATLLAYTYIKTPGIRYPLKNCSWSQISGPSTAIIGNPVFNHSESLTEVSHLQKGTYVFRVSCTYKDKTVFKDATLDVIEDTITGKVYYAESNIYYDNQAVDYVTDGCDFCYTPAFGVIVRPDLFYDYPNKNMKIHYRFEDKEEWIEIVIGGRNYISLNNCPTRLYVYPVYPAGEQLPDDKIIVRISFK